MKMAHESERSEMYYVPYVYISIHDRSPLLQLPAHDPTGLSFAPAAPAPLRVRDVVLAQGKERFVQWIRTNALHRREA